MIRTSWSEDAHIILQTLIPYLILYCFCIEGLSVKYIVLQDFDDGYFNDISIATAPPVQFSMYPPVESTPESRYANSSVYFEPLPDLAARRRNQGATANFLRLRPKISQAGFDRTDSEDWEEIEGQPHSDRSQELARLEKLVSKLVVHKNSRSFCI